MPELKRAFEKEWNQIVAAMGLPHAEATDEEFADLTWLTLKMAWNLPASEPARAGESDDGDEDPDDSGAPPDDTEQGTARWRREKDEAQEQEKQQREIRERAVYRRQSHVANAKAFLPALGSGRKRDTQRTGTAIMLPAPPALENKPALARSLRPLKQRVPSRTRKGLDEAATVLHIAEADTWFPVLRPLPEKWLDAVVLIDRWNTMAVWHRAVSEFRQLLGDAGVFRQLTVLGLETKRENGVQGYQAEIHTLLRAGKRTRQVDVKELANADGRRLFLVITDGMSPIWQSGAASRLLEPLLEGNYAALVNVLPSKLWKYSGLGHATRIDVWAGWHQTTNATLKHPQLWYLSENEGLESTPLPMMSLTPWAINRWARVVAGETTERMPGYLLPREPLGTPAARDSWVAGVAGALSAEERLEHFDEIASPLAWTLVGQLAAVAPLTMPLMRLIQQHHLPQSDATHQAEIFHAGLLQVRAGQASVGDPERVQYDFQPGLRPLLRRRISGAELFRLVRLTARYVDQQRGGGVFQAALTGVGGTQQLEIDDESLPFAQVAVDVLRELGSRYETFADLFAGALDRYENPDRYISAEAQADRLRALGEQIAQIRHVTARTEREIDGMRQPLAEAHIDLTDDIASSSKWIEEGDNRWTVIHHATADVGRRLQVALLNMIERLVEPKAALVPPWDGSRLPYIVSTDDALGIDWCWVPGGPFTMGGERYDDEKPIHKANVDGFWMMRYPVTNAQYRQFIEAGGYEEKRWWTDAGWQARKENRWTEPRHWNDEKWNGARQPVVGVSWYEAVAFCRWGSSVTGREVRLPTEAEWEKAARGTDGREYPWGNAEPTAELCNFNSNVGQTTPVGQYSPDGDSPYGCADMAGNVFDWVQDWYQAYPGNTAEDDQYRNDYGEKYKVRRGGSWVISRSIVRAAFRDWDSPDGRDDYLGFRCASTPF